MADTLENIPLDISTWVDLYAESGIAVGTKLLVQNIGSNPVKIYVGATAPIVDDSYKVLPMWREATNETGDSGAWAKSLSTTGLINVAVAAE